MSVKKKHIIPQYTNPRHQATCALTALYEKQQNPVHTWESHAAPFAKALYFGVCRYYFRLESIRNYLMPKPPKKTMVRIILLLGLYQLLDTDTPSYAAVQETVDLLKGYDLQWAKGLVNAVLRRFVREKDTILATLAQQPNFQYNHPAWFISKIQQDWPDHWRKILAFNDIHPPLSLRVNMQKSSRTDYLNLLEQQHIPAKPLHHSASGIMLTTPLPVSQLPHFDKGWISVQDEAAQLAVSLLDCAPQHRVLDACSAPGGKLCHLLETCPDLHDVTALDCDAHRVTRIHDNLHRLHLKAHCITADASSPDTWWDGKPYDRIMMDAPCSATGIIRRHPDIKLQRTPEAIHNITRVQHNILTALWPLLSIHGILLYITCSILREENDQQIARFLQETPNARILSPWPELKPQEHTAWHLSQYGFQILPSADNMDLFFYSVIMKTDP